MVLCVYSLILCVPKREAERDTARHFNYTEVYGGDTEIHRENV